MMMKMVYYQICLFLVKWFKANSQLGVTEGSDQTLILLHHHLITTAGRHHLHRDRQRHGERDMPSVQHSHTEQSVVVLFVCLFTRARYQLLGSSSLSTLQTFPSNSSFSLLLSSSSSSLDEDSFSSSALRGTKTWTRRQTESMREKDRQTPNIRQ